MVTKKLLKYNVKITVLALGPPRLWKFTLHKKWRNSWWKISFLCIVIQVTFDGSPIRFIVLILNDM